MKAILISGFSLFTGFGGLLRAEALPLWPPHWMCAEADAIIVGERVGANEVKVLEWLLAPSAGDPSGGTSINLEGLDRHGRVLRAAPEEAGKKSKTLRTHRFVGFLENKGGRWASMASMGAGSSGLIWIEEGQCFRYEQVKNPGPLELVPYRAVETEADLREKIAAGLADRRAWHESQEIAHPHEKAIVLSSYLLARTSPEGANGTYRQKVRHVLPKLGRYAVEEVNALLRTAQPGDHLGDAVLVLNDLGPAAREAVPLLVELLAHSEQVHPMLVIEALGRIGDASVAQAVLPFLDDDELKVRAEVASAMARFGYADCVPRLKASLPPPEEVREVHAYSVYSILAAIHTLAPEQGGQLTRNYIGLQAMNELRNLLEPFLVGRDRKG